MSGDAATYRDVLGRVGGGLLSKAFGAVELRLREVATYVDEWLQYQSLWDLEPTSLYTALGDDVDRYARWCCQLLAEVPCVGV
jgi:dynein heavy chain 1